MSKSGVTQEQVIELIDQLSKDQQEAIYQYLFSRRWPEWAEITSYGQERARDVARERGKDWDSMNEDERLAFVDDIVHEDRDCSK